MPGSTPPPATPISALPVPGSPIDTGVRPASPPVPAPASSPQGEASMAGSDYEMRRDKFKKYFSTGKTVDF